MSSGIFGRSTSGNYRQIPVNEYSDDSSDEGDDFIQQSIKSQQQQLQDQDQGLEMLSQSAMRLNQMSLNIHEELGYQNDMLDNMETDLDKATDNLDMLTLKTKEMIQKAGGKQNFLVILGLTGVVVVLLFLVMYT
mmetsp:Transcript_25044/g.35051  ORF Transcript_25044/g.35051 Transcript_25044/m.35051 type:complete len:135 (-) Transcript_25044:1314-1718(-)